jgi:hypothetical protein
VAARDSRQRSFGRPAGNPTRPPPSNTQDRDPAPTPTAPGLPSNGYRVTCRPVITLAFGVALPQAIGRRQSPSVLPLACPAGMALAFGVGAVAGHGAPRVCVGLPLACRVVMALAFGVALPQVLGGPEAAPGLPLECRVVMTLEVGAAGFFARRGIGDMCLSVCLVDRNRQLTGKVLPIFRLAAMDVKDLYVIAAFSGMRWLYLAARPLWQRAAYNRPVAATV